ncbi:MAG: HEPN domain-containing protein, partial [Metallosphaera sp.]
GSLDKALLMCRRSLSYFKVAKTAYEQGYYDVSATNCEISSELLIKSTFLYLGFSYLQRAEFVSYYLNLGYWYRT